VDEAVREGRGSTGSMGAERAGKIREKGWNKRIFFILDFFNDSLRNEPQ
jgi:hypothetical protein